MQILLWKNGSRSRSDPDPVPELAQLWSVPTLSNVLWWPRIFPTGLSMVMEAFKVSIHPPYCCYGPGSFLCDSVLFWKTSMSVYNPTGALIVQDPSDVTRYPYERLQGQYTLPVVLWWFRILPTWLSIIKEHYKVSIHSPVFDGQGSSLLDSVYLWKTSRSVYTLPCASYLTQYL